MHESVNSSFPRPQHTHRPLSVIRSMRARTRLASGQRMSRNDCIYARAVLRHEKRARARAFVHTNCTAIRPPRPPQTMTMGVPPAPHHSGSTRARWRRASACAMHLELRVRSRFCFSSCACSHATQQRISTASITGCRCYTMHDEHRIPSHTLTRAVGWMVFFN